MQVRPRRILSLLVLSMPALHGQGYASPASSQSADAGLSRFEIGGQVADIRTGCIGRRNCSLPSFGVGFGATANLSPHYAIDTNVHVTPKSSNGGNNFSGGHASEVLLGFRAEVRAKRYGYFLKAQPGVFVWSEVIDAVLFPTPTTFTVLSSTHRYFASDVGAGFEYSPSARIHVRAEVSDLVIHYSGSSWTNNLQPSAGVYAGLGKPLASVPPHYVARTAHPFCNKTNIALIVVSGLGLTADSVTTQRFIAQGQVEGNPFARPLVKYGWSGQVSSMALEISAETLGMYGLHRIGQHWIERLLPVCLGATHGVFAYNNTRLSQRRP